MRLEYKILWIDNDLPSYIENGSLDDIKGFLSEKGFEPIIEQMIEDTDFDGLITKYDYDLILSDYNLNATTGDKIIKKIRRDKNLDTEILFYTAQTSTKAYETVIVDLAGIERLIFHIGREKLLEKIEKVISLTLKKLLELNATRGLITAATSDLDVDIEEIYYQLIKTMDDEDDKKVREIFKNDYEEMQKEYDKECKRKKDALDAPDFNKYFSSLKNSFRKHIILIRLLKHKINNGCNLGEFNLDLFKKYDEEIIKIRNQFAHAKAIEDNNGPLKLKGRLNGQDFEFTEEECFVPENRADSE